MGFLSDLFSGGASTLVDSVGNAIDKLTTTKEEKLQLDLEMKKADWQFQTDMKKLSVEEKQLVYQDIDSARKMSSEVQTSANATKLSKNVGPFLALGTVLLTFSLFLLVIFYNKIFGKEALDPTTKDIIIYILGVLSAILGQIFSFYFGSSQGSADKNKTIQDLQMRGATSK